METVRAQILLKPADDLKGYLAGLRSEELFFDSDMVQKISDNRDQEILDYLDHSGSLCELTANLPKFDRLCIWTYTCITLLLKALSSADKAELDRLQQNYRMPEYFLLDGEVSNDRADFVIELLDICHAIAAEGKTFESHNHWLEKSLGIPDVIEISKYEDLQAIQWLTEKFRWITLSFSYIFTARNSKAKKITHSDYSVALLTIQTAHGKILRWISSLKFSSDASPVDRMLHSNWQQSIDTFIQILNIRSII